MYVDDCWINDIIDEVEDKEEIEGIDNYRSWGEFDVTNTRYADAYLEATGVY